MNRRSILNKSINRNGSAPKIICYSQSTAENRFDYKYIKNISLEKKHLKGPTSKELIRFRPIHRSCYPDSTRTIIPETIHHDQTMQRNKSFIYPKKESYMSPTTEDNNKPIHTSKRRAHNSKVYTALCKDHTFKEDNPPRKRNGIKQIPYRMAFDYTSQIINLPGGRKREFQHLNDDQTTIAKTLSAKSHININQENQDSIKTNYNYRTTIKLFNYKSTDIFNANPFPSSSNRNTFFNHYNSLNVQRCGGKKYNINNRTNNDDSKRTEINSIRIKCQGYKNISQLQLC